MLEERRVMSRFGFALVFGCACLTLTMTGCSDAWNAGPMKYVESESLTKDVGKTNLFGKPVLQDKVRKALAGLFGDSPQQIKVPAGSGLPAGGLYLGNFLQEGTGAESKIYSIYETRGISSPVKVAMSEVGEARRQEGGYAIYRRNCLHCHGVSGPAMGPRRRFCIPCPAIIARVFSSSPRPPAAPSPTDPIFARRSRTVSTALRCRRSTPY